MKHVHKGISISKREGKGSRGRGISGYRISLALEHPQANLSGVYRTLKEAKAAIDKSVPNPPKNK